MPVTPLPATALKSFASEKDTFFSCPNFTIASANGCSLYLLSEAIFCNTSASLKPSTIIIFSTDGLPSVSVPVLSTINVFILFIFSSASAFFIKTPFCAPLPTPTITDIGVAKPKAHGHAMINTAIAFTKAYTYLGSGPNTAQTIKVRTETPTTTGTKYLEILSASF